MKRLTLYFQLALILACGAFSQNAYADVKIKTRQTMQGQSYENTVYIKGKRQRTERIMGAMSMIDILMCDLKQNVQIMPASQSYLIDLWVEANAARTQAVADKSKAQNTKSEITGGGVVTMTYTNKDTGERKQMFGYTARRIVTTMEIESSPDSCTPTKNKMTTDGWYIDAAFQLDCDNERWKNYRPTESVKTGCQDRYETKTVGAARLGYPVYQKTTMYDESGKESYTMINEVVEISKAVLDDALFNIPANYREVKNQQELYAAAYDSGSKASAAIKDETPVASRANNPVNNLPKSNAVVATTVGAKKPGVKRIGLAAIKTAAVGDGINAAQLADAIGNSLAEYLNSPSVELVRIESKLPSQIEAEAARKECDFVVYAIVSHKKGGGGMFGGMLGKAAGNILGSAVPMAGSTGAAIAGQVAATTIYTAAAMSENVKSKDEISLDIKMNQSGASALAKQFKAKAKSDGEDIISPLIEQAAQAIIDAAAK